jgi:hypothetical protein
MGLIDYKRLYRAMNLSINQKKVLDMICVHPSARPSSYIRLQPDYKLTSGGIRSGLKRLLYFDLIIKDDAGVWHLRNPDMQAWLLSVKKGYMEESESLRFGEWV